MNQKLPIGEFKWIEKESDILKLQQYIKNGWLTGDEDYGFCLRVDLIVPKTQHFMNYPLAPEPKTIPYYKLSEYSKSLLSDNKSPESEKLILDFIDKKDYIIHYKNLIQYYKLGAGFRIKDVIQFEQSNWLKPYIDFNTEQRTLAANDFEKDFFKLANNSVFGKTMENVRNYKDIKICDSWDRAKYFIKRPNYDKTVIFDENLFAIHMDKIKIEFDKPIYVGFTVLELSKFHMYDFYYNKLKPMFNEVKALYTDRDCFVLHIKDDNIIQKLKQNEDYFDFSNYPKDHVLYSTKNKKVVGKYKDELGGNIMTRFIALRAKMYAYEVDGDEMNHIVIKGVKKSATKSTTFEDYYNCLILNKGKNYDFKNILSKDHQLYTITMEKKGLDPFEDKRYYINCIISEPYI